jgi:hypothetical protein
MDSQNQMTAGNGSKTDATIGLCTRGLLGSVRVLPNMRLKLAARGN